MECKPVAARGRMKKSGILFGRTPPYFAAALLEPIGAPGEGPPFLSSESPIHQTIQFVVVLPSKEDVFYYPDRRDRLLKTEG